MTAPCRNAFSSGSASCWAAPFSPAGSPTRAASSGCRRLGPMDAPCGAERLKVALEEIQDGLPAVYAGIAEGERAVLAAGIGHELERLPTRDQGRDQERRVREQHVVVRH